MNPEHLPKGKLSRPHSGSNHTAEAPPSTSATLPNPTDADEKKPKPLNPRAPPFLSGAINHPPIPISSRPASPSGDSDQGFDATVMQAAPRTAWSWNAPHSSIPASAPVPRHISSPQANFTYPQYSFYEPQPPLPTQDGSHASDNNMTQISYSENHQDGVSQMGYQGITYPESCPAPMYIQRPAYYFDKGVLWSTAL